MIEFINKIFFMRITLSYIPFKKKIKIILYNSWMITGDFTSSRWDNWAEYAPTSKGIQWCKVFIHEYYEIST